MGREWPTKDGLLGGGFFLATGPYWPLLTTLCTSQGFQRAMLGVINAS